MPSIRVATFNVENLLDRFQFRQFEAERLATLNDIESEQDRANLIRTHWNVINDENRVFTALAIRDTDAGLVCMQEVDSLRALRFFHDRYLGRLVDERYPRLALIEGNDGRGIDVAVMSRRRITRLVTHQQVTFGDFGLPPPEGESVNSRIFRRDCLEVDIQAGNTRLTAYVCHFKSMSGGRGETRPLRQAEAAAVRRIIEERFPDPAAGLWIIVGDLNDYTERDGVPNTGHGLQALVDDGFSVDLVKRIADPLDRWTHYFASERTYSQLDYILASPALAQRNPQAVPRIVRPGQPFRADRYQGPRYPRVGWDRPKASDHCPVVVDLDI